MSTFFKSTLGVVLVFALASAIAASDLGLPAAELESLLPAEGTTVDVMRFVVPRRLAELSEKLQKAIADDPDAFQERIKQAPDGKPLPYDPRIGLTTDEYEEYLRLSTRGKYVKDRTAIVRVSRKDNRFEISFDDELDGVKKIELDADGTAVRTSYGIAKARHEVKASPGQHATGPWSGYSWKFSKGDAGTPGGTLLRFGLGRKEESDRGLMYIDVKQIGWLSNTAFDHVLEYDLNDSPAVNEPVIESQSTSAASWIPAGAAGAFLVAGGFAWILRRKKKLRAASLS